MSLRSRKRRAFLRLHARRWLEMMAWDYAAIEPMPGESSASLRQRVKERWDPAPVREGATFAE